MVVNFAKEDEMFSRLTKAGLIAALAGAALQVIASAPAEAFTLAAPSQAPVVAGADVDHVWWDRWGRWHPNHYWGRPVYGYGYYHPYWLHCRWTPWGRRCW
jgi:hypothetical protein